MTSPRSVPADTSPGRPEFGKVQVLALVAGLWQVATGTTQLLPLPIAAQAMQVCTGLIGVALCKRHGLARLYGVVLLVVYGRLLLDFTSPLALDLPTSEGLVYARTTLSGLVIAMLPARRSNPLGP